MKTLIQFDCVEFLGFVGKHLLNVGVFLPTIIGVCLSCKYLQSEDIHRWPAAKVRWSPYHCGEFRTLEPILEARLGIIY